MSLVLSRLLMSESIPPKKPRALTYTEMMNGGRQTIDDDACSDDIEPEQGDHATQPSAESLQNIQSQGD